ncbi:MAG: LamG domain-containing protein [Candidatus Eisenbacteria sp.]|nr:LamG domain-containing protein [Candidatus Eisenbacteria bacterium]
MMRWNGILRAVLGVMAAWGCIFLGLAIDAQSTGAMEVSPVEVASSTQADPAEETFGAEANPTGEPIGGGEGYSRILSGGDYKVTDRDGLLGALAQARAGEVVYVDDTAEIQLTGLQMIEIPAGVTLASGRGQDGLPGGLLYSREFDTDPLLYIGGESVRVSGLRLRGPDRNERKGERLLPNSTGILSVYPFELDNCEISAWSRAAISLEKGADGTHLHHNNMHHCQRYDLGYGVCLDRCWCLIEANRFDWCRHSVAGTGRVGTGYEARYNIQGEHSVSHLFDMHGARDFEKRIRMGAWLFEEGAGGTAHDDAPLTDNHGELKHFDRGTCWVEGRRGGGLRFDGADDYIACGDHWTLNPIGGMTLMAWVRPQDTSGTRSIASRIQHRRPGAGYELRLVGSEVAAVMYDAKGVRKWIVSKRNIKSGEWTFVAFVHNGRKLELYVNGLAAGCCDCIGMTPADTSFTIGLDAGLSASSFKGTLDEVRLYHCALSEEEILRHHDGYADFAGERISIHHNTFLAKDRHVLVLRGVPLGMAEFHHNWVAREEPKDVVWQIGAVGNLRVYRNQYGKQRMIRD